MFQPSRLGLTALLDVWRFFPRGQSIRKLAYKPDKYKPELLKKPKKKKLRKNESEEDGPVVRGSHRNIYIQR